MSKISTAYDFYITELDTLFSSKNRIPNPYDLEKNSINVLKDSYGLKLGGHNFATVDYSAISQAYNFIFVFCREVIRMDHDVTSFDTVVKNLNEDIFTLRKHLYDQDNMNSTIDKINLGTTNPVGFFVAAKTNFLFIETTIQTVIREDF